MRLDFNVLWVDDQPTNVESYVERLRVETEKEGFNLKCTPVKSVDDTRSHLANEVFVDNIDLVLVDYDLGAGDKGNIAVREIRRIAPYKDIIFYSAKSSADLKSMILKEGIEGVFCAHREDLADTLIGSFAALTKKVLDIDHCRGIVMGATSDIDHIVHTVLSLMLSRQNEQEKVESVAYVKKKLLQKSKDAEKDHTDWIKDPSFDTLFKKTAVFTAASKLSLLQHLLKDDEQMLKHVNEYAKAVPNKRNLLGHVKLSSVSSQSTDKSQDVKIVTVDEMRQLRRQLITFRGHFDNLLKSVKQGQPDSTDESIGSI